MTTFKLAAGQVEEKIKEDVLGTEEKTLEETVKNLKAKKSAKRTKMTLSGGGGSTEPDTCPALAVADITMAPSRRRGKKK